MARGWYTSCHPISKMHIVGEGPGETPSTLRRLSYLINSFLTDIKHLSKNYPGGTLFYPLLMSISKVSLALIYFNKTLLHKKLQVVKPHLWPRIKILSSGGQESWCNIRLTAANFHQSWIFFGRSDAEAEAPITWPPDVENSPIGKKKKKKKPWCWERLKAGG